MHTSTSKLSSYITKLLLSDTNKFYFILIYNNITHIINLINMIYITDNMWYKINIFIEKYH